jgi:hypothetical protein
MSAEAIQSIINAASSLKIADANEAMTRLKLIDLVLFDLLQWTNDDVTVEDRIGEDGATKFSDYQLSTGRQSILVEAKKIGVNFDGTPRSRKAVCKGAWLDKTKAGDAVRQARDYGRKCGVGFCIATNGISWIAFPVNRRDQISFEESQAIVFNDVIQALTDDPDEFIGLFGRSSVIEGSLDKALLGSERDQNEPRRLNNIYDRSFSKVGRSTIFKYIEREIITAFNEELLSDNVEILERCYVQTPERTRFDSRIQMYLAPREQVLKARPIRPVGRRGGQKAVQQLLTETKLTSRPIALLTAGLVGSGKTTFLNYISKVTARDMFAKSDTKNTAHWIYADFRNFSASSNPRTFLINAIFEYVKTHPYLSSYDKSIRHAYESEIHALKTGPLSLFSDDAEYIKKAVADVLLNDYKAVEPYATKIITYASSISPVFLVVDNVDQIEESGKQASIFLEATALARTLGANLVLAMRDATYAKNRSSAVFDAFDFDAVYIDPPDILAVLSRRFTVAESLVKGKDVAFEGANGRMFAAEGTEIIQLLSSSVLGTEVGRIIEVAATGDTRLALQMTRQFLQYGYSSTIKALDTYQRKGSYQLPPHEALRAIMLGNQGIYREDFSVFGNPFDARLGRSDLQFLRIYVMYALVAYSAEREFEGMPAREIIETLERLGVSERASEQIIRDLIRFRYLFSRSHQDYTRESILIPSRLCGYVVRELLERLMFVETAMFDTFISDDLTWDTLKSNMRLVYREKNPARKFQIRKEIASVFFDFAESKLEEMIGQARQRGLPPQWCTNPFAKARDGFQADIRRAAASAQRNYGPSSSGNGRDLPLFDSSR